VKGRKKGRMAVGGEGASYCSVTIFSQSHASI
jgi:hypothetical protein